MTTLSRLPLIASFLIAAPAYAGSCPAPRAADLAVTIELSTSSGEAHGSGFIWDAAGRVVTNHHVATAGFEPRITYSDGRRVAARVIATSPEDDVAVLEPLVAGPIRTPAERAALVPGQHVVALGNPGGRGLTRSDGMVTALDRLINSGGTLLAGMIETTVPLIPGNSGGPLFDCAGRFVGLNAAAVLTATGSRAGYSIPSSNVERVAARLIGQAPVVVASAAPRSAPPPNRREPPRLGVLVTPTLGGLAVVGVTPGTPAERAGMRVGDIIRRIGSHAPTQPQEVPIALNATAALGAVPVAVDRGGMPVALTVQFIRS